MLGGSVSDRLAREAPPSIFSRPSMSSSPFGTTRTPGGAMSPPTAPARPASSLDHSLLRRSRTPDKQYSKDHPARPSSKSSSNSAPSDAFKFVFGRAPLSQYSEKASRPQGSPPSSEPPLTHSRQHSLGGQRASSQPIHEEQRGPGYSPRSRILGEGLLGSTQRPASYADHDNRPIQRYGGIYSDRAREEQTAREREREREREKERERNRGRERERSSFNELDNKGTVGSLHGRYRVPFSEREPDRLQSHAPWEINRSQPGSPESRRFGGSESGSGFGFGAIQSYTKSLGSQLGTSRVSQPPPQHSGTSLQSRQDQPTPPPHDHPFHHKPTPGRPISVTSIPSGNQQPTSAPGSSTNDEQRRKGSDDLMQHRSFLGINADGRRAGRASPLPQAVQGAQAQIIGPAGESGIKGELGRVFAGIGSGVGTGISGSVGSGHSTPMTASPFKRESLPGHPESADDSKFGRGATSTNGRKRSAKDEDVQFEGNEQSLDGRTTSSSRGSSRRGRHVHHHHHQYVDRADTYLLKFATNPDSSHHHHRHKNEEEGATQRTLSGPASILGRYAPAETVAAPTSAPPSAHHHHHHHHHHHGPRPAVSTANTAPVPPPREVHTVVNIEPLLKSIAHLPRHHLGSTLYAPRIGVPSSNSGESRKFGYTSTPVPIPRFEGKENCTFTVRVPRYRIDTGHREEICARRALWGTGVYTDDSDPVAAAIHSGYIRGEWGENVDISMLDLEVKDGYNHVPPANGDESSTGNKRVPPVFEDNKDLHITLLILPRLEKYEPSLMFGLKSRLWDGSHDGMSFKVERIEWVDEGSTRGEERSGAARRKRLQNMMQSGRICTGPSLLRMRGGATGGVRPENDIGASTAAASATVQPV
jgi:hypothetical protein